MLGGLNHHSIAAAQKRSLGYQLDFKSPSIFAPDNTGAVDASAALQSAINAFNYLYIPDGTYLINTGLTGRSNQIIVLSPNATLKAGTNGMTILSFTSKSHCHVRGGVFDGGGQTTDVSTGVKGAVGVKFDNCTYFSIKDAEVKKCGIKNAAAPTTDAGFAGFGIMVYALTGASAYGLIENCYVHDIAGGGFNGGDGIAILGQNANVAITTKAVTVHACRVSTVGRHCYSVSEGAGTSVPTDIDFKDCYGEKAALSGFDSEDGYNVRWAGVTFSACGNDQTYFDPATSYGATYRLLAGFALGNTDKNISLKDFHFTGCYYGITWGGADGLLISNGKVELSTTSDLGNTLASMPKNLRMSDVEFASAGAIAAAVFFGNNGTVNISRCIFAGAVSLNQITDGKFTDNTFSSTLTMGTGGTSTRNQWKGNTFTGLYSIGLQNKSTFEANVFKAGAKYTIAAADDNKFVGNTWTDYAGEAVFFNGISLPCLGNRYLGNHFIGTGNLTNGLSVLFDTASRWVADGNTFKGLTGKATVINNGNQASNFASWSDNEVISCSDGFVTTTGGGIDGSVSRNKFYSITGWCIDFSGVSAGGNVDQVNVQDNLAGAGVTNGLRVAVTTGAWDWCVNTGNNWHNASGTKSSLSAGNANGQTANNIVT